MKYPFFKGIMFTYEYTNEQDYNDMIECYDENSDFVYYGEYDDIESIEQELLYQGLSLEEIAEYNLNCYGRCIEVVENEQGNYLLFVGSR